MARAANCLHVVRYSVSDAKNMRMMIKMMIKMNLQLYLRMFHSKAPNFHLHETGFPRFAS